MNPRFAAALTAGRTPRLVTFVLIGLVVCGLVLAMVNEQFYRAQKSREAEVQAQILAAAVAAPLAFDDAATANDYVQALAANPDVMTVGVYRPDGVRVAQLARDGAAPARSLSQAAAPAISHGAVTVAVPVQEADADLGWVQLQLLVEPLSRRIARYAGVLFLIGMAALALVVLGVAQGALRRANGELERRALDLAASNERLQQEMEERARAEEALRQSQKMEALGQLTGGIAHDFNNLLMVTSGGLDLLERTHDETRREKLKAGIRQAVDRGSGLTRQLLTFSRRSALKPEVIALAPRIEAMRILLERSLRENIAVVLDVPHDLWPVEVDPGELEVALINLSVNARDAMPNGGRLKIVARNVPGDPGSAFPVDHICLSVQDTGVGMSEEVIARVFEPFFTTKGVGEGTGLGLSQVYGFARSSGGQTDVSSRPGQGSTISLCLPRSLKTPASSPVGEPATAGLSGGGRVLMVEDDDSVAGMVQQMFVELGFEVVRATHGAAGVEVLAADQDFQLVFSDMVMPGEMDGRDLAQHIRARYPHLPVLLTTGYSDAAEAARAEGLELLQKPYRLGELQAALEDLRSRRSAVPRT